MVYDRNPTYSSELRYEAMLPPFIIEQIRKREEGGTYERPRVGVDIIDPSQVPPEYWPEQERKAPDDDDNHGVVIIDLCRFIDHLVD